MAALVGFDKTIHAPNGAALTLDRREDFIGRAQDQKDAAATWLIGHADSEDEDEGDSHLHLQGTQDNDEETSKAAWVKVEEYLAELQKELL